MKISNAIIKVKNYIIESEMEGKVDLQDPWYPILDSLSELQDKALNEEQMEN